MSRRLTAGLALLASIAALGLAACGSKRAPAQGTRRIGTTHAVLGFVTHAGLAFGAFKLFIYDPYEAGTLKLDHPLIVTKAAAAGLFAYHELKDAATDVRDNRHLARLAGPFTALAATLALIKHDITGAKIGPAVSSIDAMVGQVSGQAASLGSPIQTITHGIHL